VFLTPTMIFVKSWIVPPIGWRKKPSDPFITRIMRMKIPFYLKSVQGKTKRP